MLKADVGRHGCGGVAHRVAGGDGGGRHDVRPTPSSSSTLVQPIGRSPRGTLPVFKTQKCWRAMLLGRWHQNTALARSIRRRQHPVAWAKLQLSTNHRARYQQLPPFQPIRAREAAAPVWRLRKRFARPCISSPAVGWLPSISYRVHEGSCFCPL